MIITERQTALTAVADRLAEAWAAADVIAGFTDDEIPQDRPEAYFIQDRMAERIGTPPFGWKIGASSAKMREIDGHEDIIPGRLFASNTFFSKMLTLDLGNCPNTKVEAEFGFRLTKDLPLRDEIWTGEEIASHLQLHPALEVIGNRFTPPLLPQPVLSLISVADNGNGVAGVFGDKVQDWQGIDFLKHPISLIVDDQVPAENFLGEMRCDPPQAVADLANLLAARDLSLQKDMMILTGTATVPKPVRKGSALVADFGTLGTLEVNFL